MTVAQVIADGLTALMYVVLSAGVARLVVRALYGQEHEFPSWPEDVDQ